MSGDSMIDIPEHWEPETKRVAEAFNVQLAFLDTEIDRLKEQLAFHDDIPEAGGWCNIHPRRFQSNVPNLEGDECQICRVETLTARVAEWKAFYQGALDAGNGLFGAIIERMKPYFPKDSRDLEWDVLPGVIGRLCKERDTAREQLEQINKDWIKPAKALRVELIEERDVARAQAKAMRKALRFVVSRCHECNGTGKTMMSGSVCSTCGEARQTLDTDAK